MKKKAAYFFQYPPNLRELDLATLISMYRMRGEIKRAEPGKFLGCAVTGKLVKQAKTWFGLTYSQEGWNIMLSPNSGGYPLTETELNILGMALLFENEGLVNRNFAEKNCGTIPKLAFMIINDLEEFGFLCIKEEEKLKITPAGVQALQGICRHIHNRRFEKYMLITFEENEPASRKSKQVNAPNGEEQTSLF